MYALEIDAVVEGSPESTWAVWTDLTRYPEWDPREEVLRLDGPFEVGQSGFSKQRGGRKGSTFTVAAIEPVRRFTMETGLPGGRLVLDHRIEPIGDGKARVTKRYEAWGPMSVAFRLVFAAGIRREMPETFAALAAEVARHGVR